MIWIPSTSLASSCTTNSLCILLPCDFQVSDQIKDFQTLSLSLCCSPCLEDPSLLHLSNSYSFFRTAFAHHLCKQAFPDLSHTQHNPCPCPLGCPAPWAIPPLPHLIRGITLFCLLASCTKMGLFGSMVYCGFICFPALHPVYTECGPSECLWLEGVDAFIWIMHSGPLLLPQLPQPYHKHTHVLTAFWCGRVWKASFMVSVVMKFKVTVWHRWRLERCTFTLNSNVLATRSTACAWP